MEEVSRHPQAQSVPGAIASVRLENFMCHERMQVDFGDHVNFVCGQNGSGKSAIIAALQCCLGATARATKRGENNMALVKTGCESAKVTVVLRNRGPDGYRREIYGDEIVVEKKLGTHATQVVIKDQHGKVVAKGRQEVAHVLDHFSCDVENPCSVMTQEHTRNFLGSGSDGKKKFKFYMEATMLQSVAERLAHADVQMEHMGRVVQEGEEQLKTMQHRAKQLESEIERAKAIQQLEKVEDDLMCQLAWSHVQQIQDQIQLHQYKVERGPGAIAKMKSRWEDAKAKADALQQEILDKTQQLEHAGESIAEIQKQRREIETRKRNAHLERGQAQNQLHQCKEMIRQAQTRKVDIAKEMEKLQVEFDSSGQEQPAQKGKLERALQQARACEKEYEEAKDEENRLAASEQQLRTILDNLQERKESFKQELEMLQKQHRRLLKQSNDTSAAFGDVMPKLVKLLEENQKAFHRPPLGPIGCLVSLVDAKWAVAVDAAINASLSCILVHDFHDMTMLKKLAAQVGIPGNRLSVVVYNFDTPPYTIQQHGGSSRRITVLDMLKCTHPAVQNILVDQNSIERVALVENIQLGKRTVFGQGGNVVKSAFTMDGTELFKIKSSEIVKPLDFQQARKGPSLGSDVAEQIKQCLSNMQHVERSISEVDREIGAMQEKLQDAGESLRKSRERSQAVLLEKAKAESLAEESKFDWQTTSQQPRVLDLSILEQELEQINEKLGTLQQREQAFEKDILLKAEAEKSLELEVAKMKEMVEQVANEEVEAEIKRSIEQKGMIDKNVEKLTENMKIVENRLADLCSELTKLESEAKAKAEVAAEVASPSHFEKAKSNNYSSNGGATSCEEVFKSHGLHPENDNGSHLLKQSSEKVAEMYQGPQLLAKYLEQAGDEALSGLLEEETHLSTELNLLAKLRALEAEKLTAKLQSVKQRIDVGESQVGGTLVKLNAEHNTVGRSLRRAKRKLEFLTAPFEHLQIGVQKRKKLLSDSEKLCSREVAHHFNLYMMRKGHVGRVNINRREETLDISVRMNATDDSSKRVKDLRSLSGGERSYATLALVLSLGHQSDCPFRVMDEFDVFMDEVNRKISLNALVEFAASNMDTQFILLTPQDLSHIQPDGQFVKVIKMQSARN